MADKNDLIIEGYYFGSFDDAKQANKEIKNAQYLNERVHSMTVTQKKALYDKMLDEKVFNTPVGWEYLKYLRKCIIEEGISEDNLRPIPLYVTFTSKNDDNNLEHIAKMYVKPKKGEIKRLNERIRISLLVNIFLVIIVIAMFAITMNSSSPNIINYKKAIVNEYSEWEQELKDKESELKEREANLNKMEADDEDTRG